VPLPGKTAQKRGVSSDDLLADLDLGLDDDSADNLPGPRGLDLPGPTNLPGISRPPPPAPKGKTVAESGVLDFIDSTADKARVQPGALAQTEFKVRRRNGRVEGPFGLGRIIAMLRNGEYQGNEDISEDGLAWRAMTSNPELNQTINQQASSDPMAFGNVELGGGADLDLGLDAHAPEPPSHSHRPPPGPAMTDPLAGDLSLDDSALGDDPHGGHGGGEIPAQAREPRARRGEDELEVGDIPELPPIWQTYRKPILIFLGAIIAILIGVFTQLFTPYGAFGLKGLVTAITQEAPPPEPVKPPPAPPKVADPKEIASLIDEHSYEGFRSVFVTIQQAGPSLPDNMLADAKARGLATLAYGTKDFPLEELKKSVDALNAVDLAKAMGGNAAAANVEILKARSALEILSGQPESAASQLAGLLEQRSDDKELALLLGLARFKMKDEAGALEALDKAIVASPTYAPALHAIGDVVAGSAAPTAADDAAIWYMKALEAQPAHARSGVMASAIFNALNRDGDRRRTMALTASKADRGLPPSDRASFLYATALAFDEAGMLSDPRAVAAAQEAARLDPTNNAYVAIAAAALSVSGKSAEALQLIDVNTKRSPQDGELLIARARIFFALDDVAKAFIDLDGAKNVLPKDHRVPLWEARFHAKLGKYTDARAALARAIKLASTDPMPLIELGRIDLSLGDVDAAFVNAENAVKLAPDHPHAHMLLGECLARRNQLEDALATFKRAIELDDELVQSQVGYANALRDMSLREKKPAQSTRLAEAIPVYLGALAKSPKNPAVLFEYGRALEIAGDINGALALYREAAAIDEKDVRPHLKMVAAFLDRQPPDLAAAQASLTRAQKIELADGQRRGDVRFWEARYALMDKRLDDASQAMQNAVEQEPRNAEFHYWLGRVLEQNNSPYEAITAYEKAISLNSRLAEAHRQLGWAQLERNAFKKALDAFTKYQEVRPEDKTVWVDLGEVYSRQNLDDQAMEAFQKAIKFDPGNGKAYLQIGNILSRKGEEKDATKYFERAVKADGKNGEAWCQLGIAKSRGRLSPEARKALQKCLSLESSPEDMKDTAKGILETAG
jgi:tetratricopeptide (TPR) repeat protein